MTRGSHTNQPTRAFAKALTVTAAGIWLLALNSAAFALDIQKVTSPGGITAWLVEEHSNPIISIRVAFKGGSTQDLPGKAGAANFAGYSEAMKNSRTVWNDDTLGRFLRDVSGFIPGTTMNASGPAGRADIDALVFYLGLVTTPDRVAGKNP